MPGKIVKARNELERIRGDVADAAKDLQVSKSEKAAVDVGKRKLESAVVLLRGEEEALEKKFIEKKSEYASLLSEMKKISRIINSSKEETATVLAQAQRAKETKEETLEQLGRATNLLEEESNKIDGLKRIREDIDLENKNETNRLKQTQQKIQMATSDLLGEEKRLADVSLRIAENVEGFRLYESRIEAFSRETGFLLNYDKLPEYVDKK